MYLAIEGVIGVGKTTLARMLQPSFDADLLLEVFEENPFLSNFYGDRARYAFQTQMFFLLSRYHQQRRGVQEHMEAGRSLISDYTFEKDALFARINLAGDELEMYYRIHEALAEKTVHPDLIVYLRTDADMLMQRIALRDRPYERQMERGYIEQLVQSYDAILHRRHPSPLAGAGDREQRVGLRPQPGRSALYRRSHPPGTAPFTLPGSSADGRITTREKNHAHHPRNPAESRQRWTAARLRQDRNVVCVYLTGSLLSEEPLLGGTTDIDLIFVHPNDPEKPREIVRLTDEVHLDVAHLSQSVFHQPRHLRLDAWVGSYLCAGPLMLHDTQHWFEFTQASAFSQFFRPENVMERSRPAADAARQTWLELHSLTGAPDAHARWAYLKALENAANAIAVLNGPPLTERRFLLQFPQRAQTVGRPGLAGGLVDLFMPEKPDAETWQMWLENWRTAFNAASQLPDFPPRLHPCRQRYYERARGCPVQRSPRSGRLDAAAHLDAGADQPARRLFPAYRLGKRLPELRAGWSRIQPSAGLAGYLPGFSGRNPGYLGSTERSLDPYMGGGIFHRQKACFPQKLWINANKTVDKLSRLWKTRSILTLTDSPESTRYPHIWGYAF